MLQAYFTTAKQGGYTLSRHTQLKQSGCTLSWHTLSEVQNRTAVRFLGIKQCAQPFNPQQATVKTSETLF